jgi:hypothetical protein
MILKRNAAASDGLFSQTENKISRESRYDFLADVKNSLENWSELVTLNKSIYNNKACSCGHALFVLVSQ